MRTSRSARFTRASATDELSFSAVTARQPLLPTCPGIGQQRAGEEPDAAVGVEQHAAFAVEHVGGHRAHDVDQRGGAVGAGLEERAGRDAPAPAGDVVVDPQRRRSRPRRARRPRPRARRRAATRRRAWATPARAVRRSRPRRATSRTSRRGTGPRRSARRATGAPPGSGRARPPRCSPTRRSPARPLVTPSRRVVRNPHGSSAGPACTTGSRQRPRRRSESVTSSTLAATWASCAERREVAATAAVGDVRAPGCDPVRRGFDDAHDRALVGSVTAADLDLDQLAGEGVVDQHDAPVVPPGQRRTAGDQALGPHDLRHAGSLRER